jgi:hypothetical protein
MKTLQRLAVLILASGLAEMFALGQTYVTPMMGGGQTAADMVHIDIFYDESASQLHAQVDDSFGTPELRPLPSGCAFDPQQPYAVLTGKAYNSQYGWNVGGLFALPPGAAIWIELLDCSPGLETYSGWGRLASYAPLFGTAGSPTLWKWSGVMVHNTYAVLNPPTDRLYAEYHLYLGDAITGSRTNYLDLGGTTVRLEWTTAPVDNPMTFKFGAIDLTNSAPLCFINAGQFTTNSTAVVNFHYTNGGPCALQYQCALPLLVVPATAGNGGPAPNHAALGSHLEMQLVSLIGPTQGCLSFREPGKSQPCFTLPAGASGGTNKFDLSQGNGSPDADPFGFIQGRSFALSRPGLYCLGFQLLDSSTNGPAGGPLHTLSPVYQVYLQAGLTINAFTRNAGLATALFGGEAGKSFWLERSFDVGPLASWHSVAGPLPGTNQLQHITDPDATSSRAFYRLSAH